MSQNRDDVRLLVSDLDDSKIFTDADIDRFLALRGGNVFPAAALALRTIAGNEVLVLKRITLLDLETDGPAVSRELRALAETFERMADDDASAVIVEVAQGTFGRRNRLRNEIARRNG